MCDVVGCSFDVLFGVFVFNVGIDLRSDNVSAFPCASVQAGVFPDFMCLTTAHNAGLLVCCRLRCGE